MSQLLQLEGLDRIDWGSFQHAYGSATLTPQNLRDLASSDAATREYALDQLDMSICHQGSLYTATAPAIPFLVRIWEEPAIQERDMIMEMLAEIAERATAEPGAVARGIESRWTLHSRVALLSGEAPGDPQVAAEARLALGSSIRAAFSGCLDSIRRIRDEAAPPLREQIERVLTALTGASADWSGDCLGFVLPRVKKQGALSVFELLQQHPTRSYKAWAKAIDNWPTLSGALVWWALKSELGETRAVEAARDALSRDVHEQIRGGWGVGKHHPGQYQRLRETWAARFPQRYASCLAATRVLESAAQGWLPQDSDDPLIRSVVQTAWQLSGGIQLRRSWSLMQAS